LDLKSGWGLLVKTFTAWLNDYAPSMGAALAYYTLFSMAPLLLIVVSVAGLVFGQDAARGEIEAQLRMLVGEGGARAVQDLLASVRKPTEGVLATVVGLGLLVLGATTVFAELQDALDRIWRVPARQRASGWLSLVVSAALAVLGRWVEPSFGGWYWLASTASAVGAFAMISVMFALIYKVMPSVRVQWRDVWIGALFTALLFNFGKLLIGLYIGHSGVVSGFGAAGSLVVILLWLYYSAQIFLLGAEFTWVYANTFGSRRPEVAVLAV
jgi:membrane protein